jgi:methylated-DNA-[protein]-cysteine S-methyltransferase
VVGKNGSLTGYAGGLKRKQFLLDLEEPAEIKSARLF